MKNLDYELNCCLVVFTGDIAYSGAESEYLVAWGLFDEITNSLKDGLTARQHGQKVPIEVIVVPGNHDCDFSGNSGIRKILREGVAKDHSKAADRSIVQSCTEVQRNYFQFLNVVKTSSRKGSSAGYDPQLYYEYNFSSSGKSVTFLCCNTAWLSEIHETQGELLFPANAIPEVNPRSALVIAAFHHPYNWIEANSAREFRKRIESVADIVLTGHEHDATRRTQEVNAGQFSTYLEGGALQESRDPSSSAFNAFVIDTDQGKQKFAHFKWNGNSYSLADGTVFGEEGSGLSWFDLKTNIVRKRESFLLAEAMSAFLDDPGVPLHHRDKGNR